MAGNGEVPEKSTSKGKRKDTSEHAEPARPRTSLPSQLRTSQHDDGATRSLPDSANRGPNRGSPSLQTPPSSPPPAHGYIATYRKDKNDGFPHPQPSDPRRHYGIPFPPPTNIAEPLFNNVPSHMHRQPLRQHDGPPPHTNANVAEPGQDMHVGPYDIRHPRAQFPPNHIDPYSSSYSTPGRRPSTNTFGAQSPGVTGNIILRPTPLPSFRESFNEEYEHRYGVPAPTSYPTSNAGLTSWPVLHEDGPTVPTGNHTPTTPFPTGNPSPDPNPGSFFSHDAPNARSHFGYSPPSAPGSAVTNSQATPPSLSITDSDIVNNDPLGKPCERCVKMRILCGPSKHNQFKPGSNDMKCTYCQKHGHECFLYSPEDGLQLTYRRSSAVKPTSRKASAVELQSLAPSAVQMPGPVPTSVLHVSSGKRILQKNRTSTCSGSSELYTIDDERFGEGFINKGDITQEDVTQEDAQPEDEEGSNEVKSGDLSDGQRVGKQRRVRPKQRKRNGGGAYSPSLEKRRREPHDGCKCALRLESWVGLIS